MKRSEFEFLLNAYITTAREKIVNVAKETETSGDYVGGLISLKESMAEGQRMAELFESLGTRALLIGDRVYVVVESCGFRFVGERKMEWVGSVSEPSRSFLSTAADIYMSSLGVIRDPFTHEVLDTLKGTRINELPELLPVADGLRLAQSAIQTYLSRMEEGCLMFPEHKLVCAQGLGTTVIANYKTIDELTLDAA